MKVTTFDESIAHDIGHAFGYYDLIKYPDAHVHKRNFIKRDLRSLFGSYSENKKRSLHRIGNSADFLLRITFLRLHPRR